MVDMPRYLVIDENGVVVNSAEWNGLSEWPLPKDFSALRSDIGQLNDTWDGVQFTPGPVPTPIGPSKLDQLIDLLATRKVADVGLDNLLTEAQADNLKKQSE